MSTCWGRYRVPPIGIWWMCNIRGEKYSAYKMKVRCQFPLGSEGTIIKANTMQFFIVDGKDLVMMNRANLSN